MLLLSRDCGNQTVFTGDRPVSSPFGHAFLHHMGREARIERLRLERTIPIQHLPMSLMPWIGQRFKIFRVSSNSANVLGWAGARSFQAKRIAYRGLRGRRAFEDHVMHPVVSEIVMIFE